MVKSNIKPQNVNVDWGSFKGGSVDVLVHWNISETTETDDMNESTYTAWQYEEARIRVPLPAHARSQATAQEYLNGRYQALLMLAGADVIPARIEEIATLTGVGPIAAPKDRIDALEQMIIEMQLGV
ncbi:MAG: hypothetical protein BWY95_00289 [Bacteroidetes bacterium ADurb.BinA104]|nr:MAG: hypothetical protein BWY95_00289 [Bacteroidetes bacterium ADurb.BinA104]